MSRLRKTLTECWLAGAAALAICACRNDAREENDASEPDAPPGCTEASQELRSIVQGLGGEYLGAIMDSGGEVPCRYDGSAFELSLEVDPGSQCADDSFCPRDTFECELSGTAEIDDVAVGRVSGFVYLSRPPSAGLSVILRSAPVDEGLDADPLVRLEGREQSRDLGGVGSSHYWVWPRSAGQLDAGTDALFERCTMTINELR